MFSFCCSCYVVTLNPSAVHKALSCLFTLQGARGNDGLPGPAGPPVRITHFTHFTLHLFHPIVFFPFIVLLCVIKLTKQ